MNTGKFSNDQTEGSERERLRAELQSLARQADGEPVAPLGDQRRKTPGAGWIVLLCLLLAAGVGTGVFLWSFSLDDGLIFDNVYAMGLNLGGMTRDQAQEALERRAEAVYGQPLTVQLPDRQLVLSPEEVHAQVDASAMAEAAFRHGRQGNLFQRARARSEAAHTTFTLELHDYLRLNEAGIRQAVNWLHDEIERDLIQPTVTVVGRRPDLSAYALPDTYTSGMEELGQTPVTVEGGQKLVIQTGVTGRHLDGEALYRRIVATYEEMDLHTISVAYEEALPDEVDLPSVYQSNCLEPVDAVLDETTYVASKEILGYGFPLDEVQKQLDRAGEGQTIQVDFQILYPKQWKALLEKDLFRDVLAEKKTAHTDNADRTRNLELACAAIDGYLIKPGATFSFNDVVGERTAEKGYREATVYYAGASVPGLGGGVCQVSSTLYYGALYADLEIVDRHLHQFAVDYVPLGMDATVQWGYLDFQFRNNTDYPIRIAASVHDGYVDIALIGTDTKDYYVEMDYVVLEEIPWQTVEKVITDGSYQSGQVITTPYTGYVVETYRYKYDKETDQLISKEYVAVSDYDKRDREIAVTQGG